MTGDEEDDDDGDDGHADAGRARRLLCAEERSSVRLMGASVLLSVSAAQPLSDEATRAAEALCELLPEPSPRTRRTEGGGAASGHVRLRDRCHGPLVENSK